MTLEKLPPWDASGSHAKIIIFDDRHSQGKWTIIIGSCNYLSSLYDSLEISLRSQSKRRVSRQTSYLLSAQVPASNAWPPGAWRLDNLWDEVRTEMIAHKEGRAEIVLLVDQDHYAYVTDARDCSIGRIAIGCDLHGMAAETSVLVPMERATQLGRTVSFFTRGRARNRSMTAAHRSPTLRGDVELILRKFTIFMASF